jgi:hypothetical protein
MIKKIFLGIPEFNVPVFDPLKLEKLNIEQGGSSPVNLKIHLRNFELNGLSGVKFTGIQGFGKEFDNTKMELKFSIPTWQIFGPYKFDGRVLILPVQG